MGDQAEPFWLAVRGNLDKLADVTNWWRIVLHGPDVPPDLSEKDREYVRKAFDMLPPEPWDRNTWKAWTDAVKEETRRRGKMLFAPAPARAHRTGFWSGACGSVAASGSGRNTGPTTLILLSSPVGFDLLTFGVTAMRLSVSASSPPSRFACVSGSAAGSGRELG